MMQWTYCVGNNHAQHFQKHLGSPTSHEVNLPVSEVSHNVELEKVLSCPYSSLTLDAHTLAIQNFHPELIPTTDKTGDLETVFRSRLLVHTLKLY